MAHLLTLGSVANERRQWGATTSEGRGAPSPDSFALLRGSHEGFDRWGQSSPPRTSGGGQGWQLPLPPVRFPLRDALLSFQDSGAPLSSRTSQTNSTATAETKGPIKVSTTQKSRAIRQINRRRRAGMDWTNPEAVPQQAPQFAPSDSSRPISVPKGVHSVASRSKHDVLQNALSSGVASWPILEDNGMPAKSKSTPNLASAHNMDIPSTWTSSARAVLAHNRRFGGAKTGVGLHSDVGDDHGESAAYYGPSMHSCRSMPTPVKEWAIKGLEFTDSGLGIGARGTDMEILEMSRRSPGPIYEQNSFGSVSLWSQEATCPTKQPCAKFGSTETHRIGVRRDPEKRNRPQPGPGTYEFKGFAEELASKCARRPKGDGVTVTPH